MTTETKTNNLVMPGFNPNTLQNIEQKFNEKFLLMLYQLRSIPEGEIDPVDVDQFNRLSAAYQEWYANLTANPLSSDAYQSLNEAVGDCHELLLHRDTQIFDFHGDFFSKIFRQPGIQTRYLVEQLGDGADGGEDYQENLWSTLIALYRQCIILCIYTKMPIVREMIDMICLAQPTGQPINARNILEAFKGKRRLRRMIMKLFKRKDNYFEEVLEALQKVMASFAPNVNAKTAADEKLRQSKQKQYDNFVRILEAAGVTTLTPDEITTYINQIEDKAEVVDVVETKQVSTTQHSQICDTFFKNGLQNANMSKMMNNLNSTMGEVMEALQNQDEAKMQELFMKTGINFNKDEMENMQKEWEEKFADEDDEESTDTESNHEDDVAPGSSS